MLIRTFNCRVVRHDGTKNTFLDTASNYDEMIKKVRNYSNVKNITMIQAITEPYEYEEMFSATIIDKLTETLTHTPFYNTEVEARKEADNKIKRLEVLRNAIGCNRFEIESVVIK